MKQPVIVYRCEACQVGWDSNVDGAKCWACRSQGEPGMLRSPGTAPSDATTTQVLAYLTARHPNATF